MYKNIKIPKGTNNIFKFRIKLSVTKRNIDSDKTIKKIPVIKTKILDFLYSLFSFGKIVRNKQVKIKIGIYNGVTNLLYNS